MQEVLRERELLDVLLAGEGLPDTTELSRLVAPEDEVPELPLD